MIDNFINSVVSIGISFAVAIGLVGVICLVFYVIGTAIFHNDESREEDFF